MPKYLLAGLSVDSEVPLPVHSCNYTLETTKTPDLVYRISELEFPRFGGVFRVCVSSL